MKEATGELSMTAIVVVILAVVAVIAPIIVRTVGNSLKMKAACQASYGCDTTACKNGDTGGETATCKYRDDSGAEQSVTCSCKDLGYSN